MMGRRRESETPQRTSRGTGPGEPPGSIERDPPDNSINDGVRARRRTMVISEEKSSGVRIQHSKDCSYEYKEDPWERSPKTDYTYSRSGSYTVRTPNNGYESPNMSRRSMHRGVAHSDSCTGGSSAMHEQELGSTESPQASTSTLNSNWQQQQTIRVSESRSFNSSHLGHSSNLRSSRSTHSRVGTATQTSPGGHFLSEDRQIDGSGDKTLLRHLHGLDVDVDLSSNGATRRKLGTDLNGENEMGFWQYIYYSIVTFISSIAYGDEKHHGAAKSNSATEETVGVGQAGYIDPASTKRRRVRRVIEVADPEPSFCHSIYRALLTLLRLIIFVPLGLVGLCLQLINRLVTLPGDAVGRAWRKMKYCMSGVSGVALQTDTYILSRISEAQRRNVFCWCCPWICLITLPLLIGGYYFATCGGMTAVGFGGYLPFNNTYDQTESPKPIIIPPPIPTDKTSEGGSTGLGGGITMAEIDQRIREVFLILYSESSEKSNTELRGILDGHRNSIDGRLDQLKISLELLRTNLMRVENKASELEGSALKKRDSEEENEMQIIIKRQSELKQQIDGIIGDLQTLQAEQKNQADAAATTTQGLLDQAAKSRELDLERRLRDSYMSELATLQQKLATTSGRDRDSLERLGEELNRLKAQLLLLSSNQNKDSGSTELDPKYLQMIQDNRDQMQNVLLEIKLLRESAAAAGEHKQKTASSADDKVSLMLSEEELNDKIKILASSLAAEVRADQQKDFDRQGAEFRESLASLEVKLSGINGRLAGMESKSPSREGSDDTGSSSKDYSVYAREIESISVSLGDLRDQLKTMSERFTKAEGEINSNEGRTRANTDSISGLESRLLNLSASNAMLSEAYNNLLLQISNCCRSTADLNAAIKAGIAKYMDLVMHNTTDGSKDDASSSAFALWLSSQLNKPGDIDEKISAMADTLHKQFTEGQKAMMADFKASISTHSSSSTSITEKTSREEILAIIREQLSIYDADKTGKFDFALETAGGSVVSVRCTRTFMPRTGLYSVLGVPLWYTSNSPRVTIQPGLQPGECWAFEGSEGFLVVQPSSPLVVREVSIEHISKKLSPSGRIDSAPKNFTIWSLQEEYDQNPRLIGNFTYDESKDEPLQTFQIENTDGHVSRLVELKIHSNHGHPAYTCLYRFRVHGSLAYTGV